MSEQEIHEHIEHAHERGEKGIGLTTAIWAVLLAIATLMSHRAHTEEIVLQTHTNDQWGFYQAKHGRAHQYGVNAEMAALLPNGHDLALKYLRISTEEECGVPAEPKGCASPLLRNSPVLQQLLAESKGGPKKAEKAQPSENKPAATAAEPAKAGEEKSEKSEKAGKEGGAATRDGATKIQEEARKMEQEARLIAHKANYYDGAELFMEISIVLCSIALLTGSKVYWKLSFLSTVAGVLTVILGLLLY